MREALSQPQFYNEYSSYLVQGKSQTPDIDLDLIRSAAFFFFFLLYRATFLGCLDAMAPVIPNRDTSSYNGSLVYNEYSTSSSYQIRAFGFIILHRDRQTTTPPPPPVAHSTRAPPSSLQPEDPAENHPLPRGRDKLFNINLAAMQRLIYI